jgi:hypothetical protein
MSFESIIYIHNKVLVSDPWGPSCYLLDLQLVSANFPIPFILCKDMQVWSLESGIVVYLLVVEATELFKQVHSHPIFGLWVSEGESLF